MTKTVKKWSSMSHKFSTFFLTKLKIKGLNRNCVLCHKFPSNQDLDMFGIAKCLSEPCFCESVVCGKMARNGLKMANSYHCVFLSYPVFIKNFYLIFFSGIFGTTFEWNRRAK